MDPELETPSLVSSTCPACGAAVGCGAQRFAQTGEPCWCMAMPALPIKDASARTAAAGCLCPDCLRRALDAAR